MKIKKQSFSIKKLNNFYRQKKGSKCYFIKKKHKEDEYYLVKNCRGV